MVTEASYPGPPRSRIHLLTQIRSIAASSQQPGFGSSSAVTRAFQRYMGRGAVRLALERYVSRTGFWQNTGRIQFLQSNTPGR
jgi:hypothetical protein